MEVNLKNTEVIFIFLFIHKQSFLCVQQLATFCQMVWRKLILYEELLRPWDLAVITEWLPFLLFSPFFTPQCSSLRLGPFLLPSSPSAVVLLGVAEGLPRRFAGPCFWFFMGFPGCSWLWPESSRPKWVTVPPQRRGVWTFSDSSVEVGLSDSGRGAHWAAQDF